MKTAEEILQPFIETPFRHTKIVEKDNALQCMQEYADQFRGLEWIDVKKQKPEDYKFVLYIDERDNSMHLNYFVWSQTPVLWVKYWMPLPALPLTKKCKS